jgi:phosphotransferase system HPr-like phosphotransfer protein
MKILKYRFRPIIKREYEELPKLETKKIDEENYRIFIPDVVVGIQNEDYFPLPWAKIIKECCSYDSEAYFETPRRGEGRASGKNIMDLMQLELCRDSLVDITIEGDCEPEVLFEAMRIYSGITTRDELPNFERLMK